MRSLLLILSLLLSLTAHASMLVDRTILTFEPGAAPRHDVSITNPDNENLYIEVTVLDVANPGTEQETRTPVKDPESIGLVAAPRLLMIPAGGRRTVRLVNLNGHGDSERVYRVNITPVAPPIETKGMAIRVLIGYQVLVFVAPQKPQPNLVGRRKSNILTLENQGNVNLMLSDGQQCPTITLDSCAEITGRRLYPGNRYQIELPNNGPLFFRVTDGDASQMREF